MNKIDIINIRKKKSIKELLEFSIINLDKPAGPTSFVVGQRVKNLLGLRKTSHFGTLDPIVTGVLPIGLNRACKLSDFFMHRNKVYVGEMLLHQKVSREDLEREMKKLVGTIIQLPPQKSRVKRVERPRTINEFKILGIKGKKVEFLSDVQAGTYIRKLIHDLGERIGGAHMTGLKRTRAGLFEDKNMISMEYFEEAVRLWKEENDESKLRKILTPAEILKELIPVVQLNGKSLRQLLTGKPVMKHDIASSGTKAPEKSINAELFLGFFKDKFIGVYEKIEDGDIIGKPKFVLS